MTTKKSPFLRGGPTVPVESESARRIRLLMEIDEDKDAFTDAASPRQGGAEGFTSLPTDTRVPPTPASVLRKAQQTGQDVPKYEVQEARETIQEQEDKSIGALGRAAGAFGTVERGIGTGLGILGREYGAEQLRRTSAYEAFLPEEQRADLEKIRTESPELGASITTALDTFKKSREAGKSIDEAITDIHDAFPDAPDGFWGAMEVVGTELVLVGGFGAGSALRFGAKALPRGFREFVNFAGLTLRAPLAAEEKVAQLGIKGAVEGAKAISTGVRGATRALTGQPGGPPAPRVEMEGFDVDTEGAKLEATMRSADDAPAPGQVIPTPSEPLLVLPSFQKRLDGIEDKIRQEMTNKPMWAIEDLLEERAELLFTRRGVTGFTPEEILDISDRAAASGLDEGLVQGKPSIADQLEGLRDDTGVRDQRVISPREPSIAEKTKGTTVVDDAGLPRVVYHGSRNVFKLFNPGSADPDALYGPGVYFTSSPEVAGGYAETKSPATYFGKTSDEAEPIAVPGGFDPAPGAANITPVYLQLRNPLDLDAELHPLLRERVDEILQFRGKDTSDKHQLLFGELMLDGRSTNKDAYELMTDYYEDAAWVRKNQNMRESELDSSLTDIQVAKKDVNEELHSLGFDGMTHGGGGRVSGKAGDHQVWIVFPDDDAGLGVTGIRNIPYSILEEPPSAFRNRIINALSGPDPKRAPADIDRAEADAFADMAVADEIERLSEPTVSQYHRGPGTPKTINATEETELLSIEEAITNTLSNFENLRFNSPQFKSSQRAMADFFRTRKVFIAKGGRSLITDTVWEDLHSSGIIIGMDTDAVPEEILAVGAKRYDELVESGVLPSPEEMELREMGDALKFLEEAEVESAVLQLTTDEAHELLNNLIREERMGGYQGPQPGLRNADRIDILRVITPDLDPDELFRDAWGIRLGAKGVATGKKAFLKRLRLESGFPIRGKSKSSLSWNEQLNMMRSGRDIQLNEASKWIEQLPDKYLDNVATSFVRRINDFDGLEEGFEVLGTYGRAGRSKSGEYPALITIAKEIGSESQGAGSTIIHEVVHHLEQFIPSKDMNKLFQTWEDEMFAVGNPMIARLNKYAEEGSHYLARQAELRREIVDPLTGELFIDGTLDMSKLEEFTRISVDVKDSYRYFGGFREWLADTLTDEAVRQRYMQIPETRNIIQKILDVIRGMAAATRDFWLGRGEPDYAARVYANLMSGNYPVADKRFIPNMDGTIVSGQQRFPYDRYDLMKNVPELLDAPTPLGLSAKSVPSRASVSLDNYEPELLAKLSNNDPDLAAAHAMFAKEIKVKQKLNYQGEDVRVEKIYPDPNDPDNFVADIIGINPQGRKKQGAKPKKEIPLGELALYAEDITGMQASPFGVGAIRRLNGEPVELVNVTRATDVKYIRLDAEGRPLELDAEGKSIQRSADIDDFDADIPAAPGETVKVFDPAETIDTEIFRAQPKRDRSITGGKGLGLKVSDGYVEYTYQNITGYIERSGANQWVVRIPEVQGVDAASRNVGEEGVVSFKSRAEAAAKFDEMVEKFKRDMDDYVSAQAEGEITFSELPGGLKIDKDPDIVNMDGRDIVRLEQPNGDIRLFYLRTGTGGQPNAPSGGAGHWVPFDGLSIDMPAVPRGWFIKTAYAYGPGWKEGDPLFRYGTQELKDVGLALDELLGNVVKGRQIPNTDEGLRYINALRNKLEPGKRYGIKQIPAEGFITKRPAWNRKHGGRWQVFDYVDNRVVDVPMEQSKAQGKATRKNEISTDVTPVEGDAPTIDPNATTELAEDAGDSTKVPESVELTKNRDEMPVEEDISPGTGTKPLKKTTVEAGTLPRYQGEPDVPIAFRPLKTEDGMYALWDIEKKKKFGRPIQSHTQAVESAHRQNAKRHEKILEESSPIPVVPDAPTQLKNKHRSRASTPRPKIPTPSASEDILTIDDAPDFLARAWQSNLPGERIDQTALALLEASIGASQRHLRRLVDEGNETLLRNGIGTRKGRYEIVFSDEDKVTLDELYNYLHNPSKVESGELTVPDHLKEPYDELRKATDWEENARISYDPNMQRIEDYFSRGWQPPEGAFTKSPSGLLITNPNFRKHRRDATYLEMRELGFVPAYWNPYEQFRMSALEFARYRQQAEFVKALEHIGDESIIRQSGGAPHPDFRIPDVGRAFRGDSTEGNKGWEVRNEMADVLEAMYGPKPPADRTGKIFNWLTFVPKKAKLFGSFFQQRDFLIRYGVGAFHGFVDSMLRGDPVDATRHLAKYPRSAFRMLYANASPGYRRRLADALDSEDVIVKGRDGITLKAISAAGLSTRDITILPPDTIDLIKAEARKRNFAIEATTKVGRAIKQLDEAMRRGLFEGVYPAAITEDLKNNIVPVMVRLYGDKLTDAQICRLAAKAANVKYSTIPRSQSVIRNKAVYNFLSRAMFSLGESEGLLRQAAAVLPGKMTQTTVGGKTYEVAGNKTKLFWAEHWIGAYLFFITAANVIHYATTSMGDTEGEVLPSDRYSPITKTDGFGSIGGYGYNVDFASPNVPFTGRSGTQVTLDLVSQMDTAFRVLDPGSFVEGRLNVLPRTLMNQYDGTSFTGDDITDLGWRKRLVAAAIDMFAPIGPGTAAAGVAKEVSPLADRYIAEQEPRLGALGQLLQATGENFRSQSTEDLTTSTINELGYRTPDGEPLNGYDDISPFQMKKLKTESPVVYAELLLRDEDAAAKGNEAALLRIMSREINDTRMSQERALVSKFFDGGLEGDNRSEQMTFFRNNFSNMQKTATDVRKGMYKHYDYKEEREITDPYKKATHDYYDLYDQATDDLGNVDYEKLEILKAEFKETITDKQWQYIEENSGLTEHPELIQGYLKDRDYLADSGFWDIPKEDRDSREAFRQTTPNIDSILVVWWGREPVTAAAERLLASM